MLVRADRAHPNRAALAWLTPAGPATMSWRQLVDHACTVAAGLADLAPGQRVILAGANSVQWIAAMYGCALAGLSVAPISPWATAHEATQVIDHTRAARILAHDNTAASMRHAAEASATRPEVRAMAQPPTDHRPELRDLGRAEDEFLVQHTSGTTGEPKAASLTHVAVLNCAAYFVAGAGARDGDVWLNPLPVYHVGGFVSGVLGCLMIGGTYVVVGKFSPAILARMLREIRPALVGLVPTMIIDLLADATVTDQDFTSVRAVIGGATDVDPRLVDEIEQLLGIKFLVGYGQSESPCMAMTVPTDDPMIRTRTLGRPLPGRDYYIADPSGDVARTGEAGELFVRGPLNMSGYLDNAGEIDGARGEMNWRGTGDRCSMDSNGVLTFNGRLRDIIVRGGTTIYPGEVERAMSAHPLISEVAVFGLPDRRLGETVAAAVITTVGAQLDAEALEAFARQRLGVQKRPTAWFVVQDFPRTSAGKVRKHLLRERCCAGQ